MPRVSEYSHADKIAALRRCADETGEKALWLARYRRWHRSIPDRATVPSIDVVGPTAVFAVLCEEAGVEFFLSKQPKYGRNPDYTPRVKLNAIRQFAEVIHPETPTLTGYKVWRVTQPGPLPSATAFSRSFTWDEVMEELDPDYVAPFAWQPSENEAAELDAFLSVVERELGERPGRREWNKLRKERPELGLPTGGTIQQRMKWSEFVDPDRVRNV